MFLRKNKLRVPYKKHEKKKKKKFKGFSNLYLGHENGKSGQEFILYIADAVIVVFKSHKIGKNNLRYFCSNSS